jgi:hypothetical protein
LSVTLPIGDLIRQRQIVGPFLADGHLVACH